MCASVPVGFNLASLIKLLSNANGPWCYVQLMSPLALRHVPDGVVSVPFVTAWGCFPVPPHRIARDNDDVWRCSWP